MSQQATLTTNPLDMIHEFTGAVVGFYTRNCPDSEEKMNRFGQIIAQSPTLSLLSEIYTREAIRGSISDKSRSEKARLEALAIEEMMIIA